MSSSVSLQKNKNLQDMTEGSSLKKIFLFTLPLLGGNLLQQLYSLVDTTIVGKGIGDHALAAVGSTGTITFLIIGFAMGLTGGVTIPISQAFGAKDIPRLKKVLLHAVLVCLLTSTLISIVSLAGSRWLLEALNTDAVILKDALIYIRTMFAGIIITVAYNLCSALLRSIGDSRTPFTSILISTCLNIVLDLIFILVFRWGVFGAGFATLIAQFISVLFCLKKIKEFDFLKFSKEDMVFDAKTVKKLFSLGLPTAIMNSITAVGCMALQSAVNSFGVLYTTAYAAGSKIVGLFQIPGASVGLAMLTFTGQNLGAKKYRRIYDGLKSCALIISIEFLLFGSILVLFPTQLTSIMLNKVAVIELTRQYVPVCGMLICSLYALFVFRSACQGLGNTFIPMCSGVMEMVARVVTVTFFKESLGFYSIAVAEVAAWATACVINAGCFFVLMYRHTHGKTGQQHRNFRNRFRFIHRFSGFSPSK